MVALVKENVDHCYDEYYVCLVQKRHNENFLGMPYSLPKGRAEIQDAGSWYTAKREFAEETNLDPVCFTSCQSLGADRFGSIFYYAAWGADRQEVPNKLVTSFDCTTWAVQGDPDIEFAHWYRVSLALRSNEISKKHKGFIGDAMAIICRDLREQAEGETIA